MTDPAVTQKVPISEKMPGILSGQISDGQPVVSGAIGSLQTRLAETPCELQAIQRLRYRVFCEELQPCDNPLNEDMQIDVDGFDALCDHLIVTDKGDAADAEEIVGTYRLLRQSVAERGGGFYSSHEFEVGSLINRHRDKRFLELGRSCVEPAYRDRRTIELLWHGTWSYILHHEIDVLFGCASFPGTDPQLHAQALSLLHHYNSAFGEWETPAVDGKAVKMTPISIDRLDRRAAIRALPPLIKGYLRLGAMVSSDVVVDEEFGTSDVLIILPVSKINPKYVSYYGENAQRHRAA